MWSLQMRMLRWFSLFMIISSQAVAGGIASTLEWDPRISRGTLENGLSYFIHDSGKAEDPFNIRLIVHAGSVDEDAPGGIAHMLEHMVFRASRNHPEGVHQYIDTLGWRQGVQVNAVTRESETQFMIRTRPNDSLDLSGSLALLRDLVFGASLTSADWESERAIILEELERSNSVADRISREKKDVLRTGSHYVGRSTIGTRERIEQAPIDDIRAFYRKFYVASNVTLVISGGVSAAEAEASVRKLFGGEPSVPKPDRDYLDFPLKQGVSVGIAQDDAGTSSKTIYAFRMAMPERLSEEGQIAYLQKYFLDRMIRAAIRRQAAVHEPSLEGLGLTLQETTNHRLIMAFSASSPDHDASLKALLEVVERIKWEGLSQSDFDEVMGNAKRINKNNVKAAEGRLYADWEDRIASAVLTGSVVDDPTKRSERTVSLLDRLSLPMINETMRTMLSSPDQIALFQVPGHVRYDPPTAAEIEAMRDTVSAQRELTDVIPLNASKAELEPVTSYPLEELPSASLVPHTGKLLSEQISEGGQIIDWALSNGDRVIWLKRDTPDGKVYLSGRSRSGFMNDTFGNTVSQAAVQLWAQSGFSFWTQDEYERWTSAHAGKSRWDFAIRSDELDVAAAIQFSDIPAMLEDYARRITFGTVRREALDAFRMQSSRQSGDDDDYAQLLYGSPSENAGEIARTVTLDELNAAARRLVSAPVTWFAVGPAPDDALRTAFSSIIGAVKRGDETKSIPRLQLEGSHSLRVGTSTKGRSAVKISFFTPMDWTPEASFLLSTLTPLTQKALKDELRYRLSGVYTLSFELKVDPAANRAIGTLSFDSRADRADELVAAAQRVLRRMQQIVRNSDVGRIRADIRFAEDLRLEDPNTWLRRLALSYRRYGNAGYLYRAGNLADRVTDELLEAYAKDVLDTQNVRVFIRDE
jgi:zinc protease